VFHRLYEQALALRSKLDQKRDAVKREEIESIQVSKGLLKCLVCLQPGLLTTCSTLLQAAAGAGKSMMNSSLA
jgi:hypothetical protein